MCYQASLLKRGMNQKNNQLLLLHCGMSIDEDPNTDPHNSSFISVGSNEFSTGSNNQPESPLDVLSRAASMVESVSPTSSSSSGVSPPTKQPGCERTPSFKERIHPKFRKTTTPDYLMAADQARTNKLQHLYQRQNSGNTESMVVNSSSNIPLALSTLTDYANGRDSKPNDNDAPLDMSIKKRSESPPPPPAYRFTPLRRSPPLLRMDVPHIPLAVPPLYVAQAPPPPYPTQRTPSPPMVNVDNHLPPPPSYESVNAGRRLEPVSFATVSSTTPTPPIPNADIAPTRETERVREITIITNSNSDSDPLLDEHFRRSLGASYHNLFTKDKSEHSSNSPQSPSSPRTEEAQSPKSANADSTLRKPTSRISPGLNNDDMEVDPIEPTSNEPDMKGYTVEDHFVKALGDTWLKIKAQKENPKPLNSTGGASSPSITSSTSTNGNPTSNSPKPQIAAQ
ncbi:mucin-2-like isoform X2 [Tigriopus californicus]|uniref:mucin-2-like isoform X2 n=1 Tax=Tigriopus californicus TaxID=6832 RepID=UPI0027DA9274|nr:mucin-2-like isoform X2 [Tigriopus californicus]